MTNKIITIGIVGILIVGLVYLGTEVKNLRAQVAQLKTVSVSALKEDPPGQKVQAARPQAKRPQAVRSYQRPRAVRPNYRGQAFSNQWDPYYEMALMQRQMDRLFNESFRGGPWNRGVVAGNSYALSTDIQDVKDKYIVSMDIPGMDKNNINVEVENNSILVSGERNNESEEKDANFYKQERSFGYFSQRFPLPGDVDTSGISVNYDKGVLTIEIPKLAKTTPPQKEPAKIKVN